MMKVAVIGGTGLMGPFLLPRLTAAGLSVTCINRHGTSPSTAAVSCDRRDKSAIKAVLRDLAPQVIIDMVPYTRKDAEILCEAVGSPADIHVIAISSIDVYQAYGRIHRTESGAYQ